MPSMPETPASGTDADLICVQLGCMPRRRRRDLRVPADLLAFLGTTRRPVRWLGWNWPRTLDELPPSAHHHNPGPAPVIEAVRDGCSLVIWCRYCRQHHRHGAHTSLCSPADCACPIHTDRWARLCLCPTGAADGHRGAHCWKPGSPYKQTGYVLREVA